MGVWENYSNMKKRLIDLMIEAKKTEPDDVSFSDYLPDYLIANGVIVPPCKIGEPVYIAIKKTSRHCKAYAYVRKSKLTYKNMARVISDFGKTVFLSYEEAENALRKGGAG